MQQWLAAAVSAMLDRTCGLDKSWSGVLLEYLPTTRVASYGVIIIITARRFASITDDRPGRVRHRLPRLSLHRVAAMVAAAAARRGCSVAASKSCSKVSFSLSSRDTTRLLPPLPLLCRARCLRLPPALASCCCCLLCLSPTDTQILESAFWREVATTMPPTTAHDRSLLTLVLDLTPSTWGERDLQRSRSDRARFAANKRSVGPGRLDDVLASTIAFCLAFAALRRDNTVVVIGVADDEVAVLYPRKGGAGRSNMASIVHDPTDTVGGKVDAAVLNESVRLGVAELVARAAEKAEKRAEEAEKIAANMKEKGGDGGGTASASASGNGDTAAAANASSASSPPTPGAAIASGVTVALCVINRFMVAAGRGVSALASDRPGGPGGSAPDGDGGIMALITGQGSKKGSKNNKGGGGPGGAPTPRILIIQASEDRTGDYNAFMNGTFAGIKGNVVIDGCFVAGGIKDQSKQSAFLEQACDRTGGVYLAVPSPAQVGGALTAVLVSVFLSPVSIRKRINLPALPEVDFRPRCFETGETVDVAHVCNQCLSIFKNCPKDACPTCGAANAKKKKRAKHS